MLRQRWSPRSSQGKIWAFSHSFFGTVRLRRPGWRRSWHLGYPASTEVVDHHQGRCELLFALFRTVRPRRPGCRRGYFRISTVYWEEYTILFLGFLKPQNEETKGRKNLFSHSETAARWLMPNLLWWINVRCFLFWDKSSIASPNR